MSLKDSVRALARGEQFGQCAGRSSLTKILKPSFTGKDSQTLVLATVSPAAKDTEHTLNTLRHACVMDGRPTEDGKSWISGGEVRREEIGEIDVKRTKAARAAEAERARPPGWTASGGDDTAGGFGVGHGDGLGGEAAAAEAARKEEAKLKLEEARRQRKAGKALENAHPEQLAVLLDARERSAKAGTGLNAHQQARVEYKAKQQMAATEEAHALLAAAVVEASGASPEAAMRAVRAIAGMAPSNASRSSKIAMALELLADAQAAKAHAALPPEEKAAAHEAREAAKEAKREKKRAAENERRGRAAYLASLPHWERAAEQERMAAGGAMPADQPRPTSTDDHGAGSTGDHGAGSTGDRGAGSTGGHGGTNHHSGRSERPPSSSRNAADANASGGSANGGYADGGKMPMAPDGADGASQSAGEKKSARMAAVAERRLAAEEEKKAAIRRKMAARDAREAAARAEVEAQLARERLSGGRTFQGGREWRQEEGRLQEDEQEQQEQQEQEQRYHQHQQQKHQQQQHQQQQQHTPPQPPRPQQHPSSGKLPSIGARGSASTHGMEGGGGASEECYVASGYVASSEEAPSVQLSAQEQEKQRYDDYVAEEQRRMAAYEKAAAARMADYDSGGFGAPPRVTKPKPGGSHRKPSEAIRGSQKQAGSEQAGLGGEGCDFGAA